MQNLKMKSMKPIIEPISVDLLKEELAKVTFVRPTNKAGNLIYDFTAPEAPNLMREVGRLREEAFRLGGGGTGKELDVDEMDMMNNPYHQLIVWDPDNEQIVGGYRWIDGAHVALDEKGQPVFSSSHLFRYSEAFVRDYLPASLELGRAFVQPAYQTREMGTKALFALDNLWDGLGSIVFTRRHLRYFMGKVTMYPSFEALSRDLIYAYMERFNPSLGLAEAYHPLPISEEGRAVSEELFVAESREENFKLLLNAVRQRGTTVPALFSAYLSLCLTLRSFGSAVNDEFGDVYETGILVPVDEITAEKYDRHIASHGRYLESLKQE